MAEPIKLDNLDNDFNNTDRESCSVCRDLLIDMDRFFEVLQNTSRSSSSEWLTVDDIASELKVSRSIVYRLIRSGEIEAVNIAASEGKTAQKGHYRVKRSCLDKYLQLKRVRALPRIRRRSCSSVKSLQIKDHLGI